MSEYKVIEGPIAADWWTLAGAAQALLTHDKGEAPSYTSGPHEASYHFTLFDPQRPGRAVGELHFTPAPNGTIVHIEVTAAFYDYCTRLIKFLDLMVGGANILRQDYVPSPDEAIERYYRSRAAGGRKTLRQLAMETGLSYEALRKHKQRYDAAGKWGSKKETRPLKIAT